MLFCTSLLALVGAADHPQSSPRKLQIVNTKVCLLSFPHSRDSRLVQFTFSGARSRRRVMECATLCGSSLTCLV